MDVKVVRATLDNPARLYRAAPGEQETGGQGAADGDSRRMPGQARHGGEEGQVRHDEDVRDQGRFALPPSIGEPGETGGRPAGGASSHWMPEQVRHDAEDDSSFPRMRESSETHCPEGTPCDDGLAQNREATPLERAVYELLTNRGRVHFDARQFLSQSSFHLSLSDLGKDADEAVETVPSLPDVSGHWSLWGRGALTRFRGVDGKVSLDGDVLTGLLGLDYAKGRWLAGAALAWHDGDGSYRSVAGNGGVDSTLVSVNPYLRYAFTERLSAWGTLGYGVGGMTLRPGHGADAPVEVLETDLGMAMGAAGLRGVVYDSATTQLALKTDVLWTSTSSAAVDGLAAVDAADTGRVRLLLSGQHRRALANDALLTPGFELGIRYDAGDAETGFGLELGGGLGYADPVRGLTLETKARALVAHEDGGYEEWGIGGSVSLDPGRLGRGLALRLASGWGNTDSGAQALWQRQNAAGIAPRQGRAAQGRMTAEVGYGLDVPWTGGILTPYGGLEWAGAARTLTLGWRFRTGPVPDAEPGRGTARARARDPRPQPDAEHVPALVTMKGSEYAYTLTPAIPGPRARQRNASSHV